MVLTIEINMHFSTCITKLRKMSLNVHITSLTDVKNVICNIFALISNTKYGIFITIWKSEYDLTVFGNTINKC